MVSPTPVPTKDVIFTDFDNGEAMLVDLSTKQYYRLNETAALIWRSLENGKALDEIVTELQSRYEVSRDHALTSIDALLSKLASRKLVASST
ncbi:MAG TPA: PqqD family protein [Pyrinomonadaceae bacterium]